MNKEKENHDDLSQLLNQGWKGIFDAIADLVFILDIKNNLVAANKAFLQAFNLTAEQAIGRKCFELMHKLNKPFPGCPYEETKVTNKAVSSEINDPNIGFPILVTSSPLFDNEGNLIGIVHVSKDISAQKKIEEELTNKIKELERFQKVTVDRELKMKELKEKIAELEARLKDR